MSRLLFAGGLAVLLAACAPGASDAVSDGVLSFQGQSVSASEVLITLERIPCFGFCPAYKLTIYDDGRGVYQGYRFVGVMGQEAFSLSQEEVRALLAAFERADYFSFADAYIDPRVTDLPSAITSLSLGGRSKTVTHYDGDERAPEALSARETAIDEIVGSERWTEGGPRR